MLRISLLVAIGVMASAVGCAQCDTCDDFPAPCVGPNCGGNTYAPPGYLAPTMDQMSPAQGPAAAPSNIPANDGVPDGPASPTPDTPSPSVPPADAAPVTSPPLPTDPIGRPGA